MPVPKRRQSHTRAKKRRTHDTLKPPAMVPCPHCHEMIRPHRVCPSCGHYKGRSVIPIVEKAE